MACNKEEQYRMSWIPFHNLGFISKYSINMEKYPDFIFEVKKQYNVFENPYHNFEHGLNGTPFLTYLNIIHLVMHCIYMFIVKTNFRKALSEFD